MKIALVGFEFESSNKGCEALTYSFLTILNKLIPKNSEIVVINIHPTLGKIPKIYKNLKFKNIYIKLKNVNSLLLAKKEIKICDIVFDITHGDSFSDIYGKKWLIQTNLIKQIAISEKKPLILLPQTYGPFNNSILENWTKQILKKTYKIYSRDNLSTEYLKKILPKKNYKKISTYTDLAFALPYDSSKYILKTNKKKIGINVSGLLWYNEENSNYLNLRVDYQKYCIELIKQLLKDEKNDIYLIPHVICDEHEGHDYFENDTTACNKIKNQFPQCKIIKTFQNAFDAKSFISNLDCLVAARMHASIAAFSSKCASIPFAYSRKFAGIYNTLGYNYIIDGRSETTEEAIKKTLDYIKKSDKLIKEANQYMKILSNNLEDFQHELSNDIENIILRSQQNEKNNKSVD